MSRKLRQMLWPGVTAAILFALLVALGTWQVQRLHWKEAILTQIARAEAAAPVTLSANPEPYSKVTAIGHLQNDLSAQYGAEVYDTSSGPELGSQLIVPLKRDDADPILVDRGWVPTSRPQPIALPTGEVTIVGYVRPAEKPGPFSATDDAATRQFYTLNPSAIAASLGLRNVAPFVLVAMGTPPPEHWPAPASHLPRPPNNHLSYAITWYGLAVSLVVIFALWARKTLRS